MTLRTVLLSHTFSSPVAGSPRRLRIYNFAPFALPSPQIQGVVRSMRTVSSDRCSWPLRGRGWRLAIMVWASCPRHNLYTSARRPLASRPRAPSTRLQDWLGSFWTGPTRTSVTRTSPCGQECPPAASEAIPGQMLSGQARQAGLDPATAYKTLGRLALLEGQPGEAARFL